MKYLLFLIILGAVVGCTTPGTTYTTFDCLNLNSCSHQHDAGVDATVDSGIDASKDH